MVEAFVVPLRLGRSDVVPVSMAGPTRPQVPCRRSPVSSGAAPATAAACLGLLAAGRRSRRVKQQRLVLKAEPVTFVVESRMQEELAATAAWLDGVMAVEKEAKEVMFGSIPRTEPVAGKPGTFWVYLDAPEIAGLRPEVRMTMECLPAAPGRAEVKVLEINAGVKNMLSGKVDYMQNPREVLDSETQAVLSWKETTKAGVASLTVEQMVRQTWKITLPWGLPIPGGLLEGILRPWILAATRSSQSTVLRGLRERVQRLKVRA